MLKPHPAISRWSSLHRYGIRLMRSRGVPKERRSDQLAARTLDKKNRQFLAKRADVCYCFSESPTTPACPYLGQRATKGLGVKDRE